jgi:hypothetical protein
MSSSSSPERAAGGGDAVLMQEADLLELLHHDGDAAHLVEVLGDVFPAGRRSTK